VRAAPNFQNTRLNLGAPSPFRVLANREHAPEHRECPSCRGKKVDRIGFDCRTCFGEGHVDE
jgi:hypothetical protein